MSYRLAGVPRAIRSYNDQGSLTNNTVTESILFETIQDYTGQILTCATETQTSIKANLYTTS